MRCEEVKMVVSKSCISRWRYPRGGNVGAVESDYKYEEKSNPRINKLLFNNKCYTDKSNICDQLNTYFINVSPNPSDQLPKQDNPNPMKYIKSSFPNSSMFRSNHVHEEHDLIKSLKNQKSTIGVPIKCVKLASEYICEAITDLYNDSIAQGIVPDILRISKVTPIDKSVDTMDPHKLQTYFNPFCFHTNF